MNFSPREHVFMARALQLARRGLYTTQPNPRVGCLIVHHGRIVGEGWHQRAGQAHAEVYALQQAGEQARGAEAYITLEPCLHYGRTPPCVDALIAAGIRRVIVAMQDPNPPVAGQGLQALQAAGIETAVGLLEQEARALNLGFLSAMERARPFVRLKLAMSLDGRTAMADGTSQWISGEAARKDVQYWRAQAAAVLTGIGTVLQDDPGLNVRLKAESLGITGEVRQPVRVVLDSHLRFPVQARMASLPGKTRVYTTQAANECHQLLLQQGVEVIHLDAEQLALKAVMQQLMQEQLYEVHVEAGASLAAALLEQGWVDELIIYMAPHLMGSKALPLLNLPLDNMQDRIALHIQEMRAIGQDWRIIAKPEYKKT